MTFWKKPEPTGPRPSPPEAPAAPRHAPPSPPPVAAQQAGSGRGGSGGRFLLGPSMQVRGELIGRLDVFIEGLVEGKIVVSNHDVVIESSGRVRAEIEARTVIVRGRLVGNVRAKERIEIASSGSVEGNLAAPRVILAEGSEFSGRIEKHEPKAAAGPAGSRPDGARPAAGTKSAPVVSAAASEAPEDASTDRRGKDRPWSATSGEPHPSSVPPSNGRM